MSEVLKKERIYVAILAALQFCHILDFVIMMPLGPQFMRVFQINPSQFGLLVSSYTFSAGIVGFLGALYADNFDRKKMLIIIFSGFILGTFLCAISPNYYFLLLARIVAGAFGGVSNAIVFSLIADLIPPERRGKATGVVMSAFSISSVIGVPIGLVLANTFHWHAPFYFIVFLSSLVLLFSSKFIPNIPVAQKRQALHLTVKNLIRVGTNSTNIILFGITTSLVFGVFMIVPFISPYMVKNVGLTEADLPYIYLVGGSFTIISARTIGKFCDNYGSFKVFSLLIPLSFIPILALTHLPPSPKWIAIACTTGFMMFVSGRFIPAMTMISNVIDPKDRGTFMSLENAMRQLFSGIASLIAGFLIYENSLGQLQNYNFIGYISLVAGTSGFFFAYHIKKKFNLR